MNLQLTKKSALATGSSSGIGAAIAGVLSNVEFVGIFTAQDIC